MHDHALGIEELLESKSVAGRAGAGRVVEREHARLERRYREAAFRTGVPAREQQWRQRWVVRKYHLGDAVAELDRGLERLGQALAGFRAHPEAIDHGLDGMPALR